MPAPVTFEGNGQPVDEHIGIAGNYGSKYRKGITHTTMTICGTLCHTSDPCIPVGIYSCYFIFFAVFFSFILCSEYDFVFTHTVEGWTAAASFSGFKVAGATPLYFIAEVNFFIVFACYFKRGTKQPAFVKYFGAFA